MATYVEDINNFYWGAHRPPYLWGTQTVRVGSEKNFSRALLIFWVDPELRGITYFEGDQLTESQTNWSVLTEDQLKMAFIEASRHKRFCCEPAMIEHGVGYGCANDIDILLQIALFEEVRYG